MGALRAGPRLDIPCSAWVLAAAPFSIPPNAPRFCCCGNFDFAEALFQIAIVLGSVSIVAASRPLVHLSGNTRRCRHLADDQRLFPIGGAAFGLSRWVGRRSVDSRDLGRTGVLRVRTGFDNSRRKHRLAAATPPGFPAPERRPLQYDDPIATLHGRQPMGDDECRPPLHQPLDPAITSASVVTSSAESVRRGQDRGVPLGGRGRS